MGNSGARRGVSIVNKQRDRVSDDVTGKVMPYDRRNDRG
jgi:hypothetical protein